MDIRTYSMKTFIVEKSISHAHSCSMVHEQALCFASSKGIRDLKLQAQFVITHRNKLPLIKAELATPGSIKPL